MAVGAGGGVGVETTGTGIGAGAETGDEGSPADLSGALEAGGEASGSSGAAG